VQSRSDAPENRPLIPPRSSRSHAPGVNRPSDALDDDAPPAYEEAAKGRPYIPPLGSPLHPSSDPAGAASPMSSNLQLTGTTSNVSNTGGPSAHPPGPNAPNYSSGGGGRSGGGSSSRPGQGPYGGRRASAYHENSQTPTGHMPGSFWDPRYAGRAGLGSGSRKPPGIDKDCVVM
jgi:hypothetical protein